MNRIVILPFLVQFGAGLPDGTNRLNPGSTYTSNSGCEIDSVRTSFGKASVICRQCFELSILTVLFWKNERQPFQSNRVRMDGRDPGRIASAESYKTLTPNEIWASVRG